MIPHNMTLFKLICVQYQFHGQTLPIMKIDRGQIPFRDYVSTGTQPYHMIKGMFPKSLKFNVNYLLFSPKKDSGKDAHVFCLVVWRGTTPMLYPDAIACR